MITGVPLDSPSTSLGTLASLLLFGLVEDLNKAQTVDHERILNEVKNEPAFRLRYTGGRSSLKSVDHERSFSLLKRSRMVGDKGFEPLAFSV
jgi:hypothetical protein